MWLGGQGQSTTPPHHQGLICTYVLNIHTYTHTHAYIYYTCCLFCIRFMHFEQKEDNAIDICSYPHDSSPLKQFCVTRTNIDAKLQFIF